MKRYIVMQVDYTADPARRKILAIKNSKEEALESLKVSDAHLMGDSGFVFVGGTQTWFRPAIEIQPFDDVEFDA